jgi:hypothetical protein
LGAFTIYPYKGMEKPDSGVQKQVQKKGLHFTASLFFLFVIVA